MKNEKGFTILEMMIVLSIIALVFLLTLPNIQQKEKIIRKKGCEALIEVVNAQILLYEVDNLTTPTSVDSLIQKGYLKSTQKRCPNGDTIYLSNGQAYAKWERLYLSRNVSNNKYFTAYHGYFPFLKPSRQLVFTCETEKLHSFLLQAQMKAMFTKKSMYIQFQTDGVQAGEEFFVYDNMYCEGKAFHYTKQGTISQAQTITCSLQNKKKTIVLQLGSGAIDVR